MTEEYLQHFNTGKSKTAHPSAPTSNPSKRKPSKAVFGKCAICSQEDIALHILMKRCRHSAACRSCLRRLYIEEAQKHISNYPLCCFDQSCDRLVRDTQVQTLARSKEEMTRHYRMTVLADAARKKIELAYCMNCDHPHRTYPTQWLFRMVDCRNCFQRYPATTETIGESGNNKIMNKAERLVKCLPKICQKFPHGSNVAPVMPPQQLLASTLQLVRLQHQFFMQHRPYTIDIGFHYTASENKKSIARFGLLTTADRQAKNVRVRTHGAAYGSGIYLANNPHVHQGYGDLGILAARLKGQEVANDGGDCVIAHRDTANEFCVLQKSHQCVALLEFPAAKMLEEVRKESLERCHRELQQLLDVFFNDGSKGRAMRLKS